MNWKETLIFPPEMPISDNARGLIERYVFWCFYNTLKSVLKVIQSWIHLVLLYNALWLVYKTCCSVSANWKKTFSFSRSKYQFSVLSTEHRSSFSLSVIIFVLKFEQYSPSEYFLFPHHLSCTVRRNHYFVTLGSERDKFNYYSATCIFLSLSQLNCSYVEFYVLLGILCSYHLATSISIHFFWV